MWMEVCMTMLLTGSAAVELNEAACSLACCCLHSTSISLLCMDHYNANHTQKQIIIDQDSRVS